MIRAFVSTTVPKVGGVPVGILAVNLVGAYMFGLLVESLSRFGPDTGRRRDLRMLLRSGLIGGYATYSALAVDTAVLLDARQLGLGAGYAVATVVLGAFLSWAGILTGRLVPRPKADR